VRDLGAGDRVGVLHVGGSSVEAAVWRQSDPATGDVVAVRVDRGAAGHAVDDVLLAALCSGVGFGRPAAAPNPDLPLLRRECERAKVALSTQTAVDVDVDGVPVRMVRSDVEELSARLLRRQLDTLAAALARSEDDEAPLRMVLLLGGAAAAPSLVQAAGARFEVPVIAVPRVSDAMAKGTIDADKLDQPEPVTAPARQPRSAMAAPNAAQADESDVGAVGQGSAPLGSGGAADGDTGRRLPFRGDRGRTQPPPRSTVPPRCAPLPVPR
jgi:molecular chaperone DnaK (HSP70)